MKVRPYHTSIPVTPHTMLACMMGKYNAQIHRNELSSLTTKQHVRIKCAATSHTPMLLSLKGSSMLHFNFMNSADVMDVVVVKSSM